MNLRTNQRETKKLIASVGFQSTVGLAFAALVLSSVPALAKVRTVAPAKAKPIEASEIKGITGDATFTLQETFEIAENVQSLEFQDGKVSQNIEFYKSPRCYLHFRNPTSKGVASGRALKVKKIDNIYENGSAHVTFWFDHDDLVSDLACISNYNHSMTVEELKATLGNAFHLSVTKSVEMKALFNTVPTRNAKVMKEESAGAGMQNSARIILTDS